MFSDRMIFGSGSHLFNSNIYFSPFILFLILALSCSAKVSSAVAQLDPAEVEILGQIAITLGKRIRDVNAYPCGKISGWTHNVTEDYVNDVTCDCSFANNTCHIVSIVLKRQNLQGVLPPELTNLPYLKEIDLTHNFLNGTIPPEWGAMPLVNISLHGNRLSGPIPKELGNSSTLKSLVLEANRFNGTLPEEIGNIVTLERILISSNEFTGQLPGTLAKLTNLKDFRISDNKFTGKIPNFIQNWAKLEKVRISDINGTEWRFPPESRMKEMNKLILRNCNLSGPIRPYIGNMTFLKSLDLSYNKLSGPITFGNLTKIQFMYLTSNLLTGDVPDWMLKKGKNIDLSYNNFTVDGSVPTSCSLGTVNLFGTSSMLNNSIGVVPCLKSINCPKTGRSSLYINCGGRTVDEGTGRNIIRYVEDIDIGSPSKYFLSSSDYWAFSSTGDFVDNGDFDTFTTTNSNISSELYKTARLSPLSLTYYAHCLINGSYNVSLHFAEIMFTGDSSYKSLGKRIFDVYIQGKLVRKDFNIEDEAPGPNKPYVMNHTAQVTTSTLEIRFYWAGKGTTSIPERGTYGPLISAIYIKSNFEPPQERSKKMAAGAVAGIVVSALFLTFLILGVLWWRGCLGQKDTMDQELRGLDLQTGSFTLRQIKAATNNFDPANKIGEGGFGPVYKGLLSNGTIIAVKQLSSKSKQGNREFVNEIGMISALQHPHLVKLYGCCIEGNQLLLIYEYMENNSLARALFGPEECQLNLDWPTRHKICVGIARGLAYLHEESRLKIVHRDIKATNVLLDKDLNPKISDFGLAKLDEEENTHISTRIAGTLGYMAPEYALRGYLTDKADVYSFGVVTLEIVSGKSNISYKAKEDGVYLLDWAYVLQERGKLVELVDPKLGTDFNMEEAMTMLNVAILCTNSSAVRRPTMSAVVSMLEGRTVARDLISDPNVSEDDMMFKAIRSKQQHEIHSRSDSQSQSLLMDGPWTGSSTSTPDLYPINLDSQYWKDRE